MRLETKLKAHRQGLLLEEGLLCGVGETAEDIARSVESMQHLDADQVRVMNFVPQPGTPMAKRTPANPQRETLISAVLRLVFPDRLIPASLDVDGLDGLKRRLEAGANVVTSVVTTGTNVIDIDADSNMTATSKIDGSGFGAIDINLYAPTATVDGKTRAYVRDGVTIDAHNLLLTAGESGARIPYKAEAFTGGGEFSLIGTINDLQPKALVTGTVEAFIGASIEENAGGDPNATITLRGSR